MCLWYCFGADAPTLGWSARVSWNSSPLPFFPPFRFVRVHGLVDEFRHVSIRPPHLVRCFPGASLCFLVRFFVSRVLVLWFPARTHEPNGSYFVCFSCFFFLGVRTEFVGRLCRALLRGNSACFSVSFFFLEREDTEEIERKKKRERAEGTQPYEVKEPGKRPVVSSSHVVVRVVRFLRTFVVERFQVFLPTVTCTKRNRPS